MSDNGTQENIIFKAILDDKTVKVFFGSNFIPMLTFALKLTEMEIENLIANLQQQQQSDISIPPKIELPKNLFDKIRGK